VKPCLLLSTASLGPHGEQGLPRSSSLCCNVGLDLLAGAGADGGRFGSCRHLRVVVSCQKINCALTSKVVGLLLINIATFKPKLGIFCRPKPTVLLGRCFIAA